MANGNNQEEQLKPSEMSVEDLPDVRAFQDEFTRSFMKSTEEVADNLYPFESGTGLYEMWIPGGTVISKNSYTLESEETFESFLTGIENNNGSESSLQMTFNNFDKIEFVEEYLDSVKNQADEDIVFEKTEDSNKDIYMGKLESSSDNSFGETMSYAIFIQNKSGDGSAQIFYTTSCSEGSDVECTELVDDEENKLTKIAASFNFLNTNSKEEDKDEQ
ncbi:hypothetical protein P6709_15370 [Jeotgalibacillus sp. ET6]|uniref:hypothetical protein n=1 Tax=Jeotgalibacillus sp. ET6 TaxID=3037260 RepID=UPI0024184BC7|nr:hypothetical protein [Jeotgalibacillus sp. ET6]MDG5473132.1 hypothetical protein [Jeotgalibacillus sp. ET6]